MVHYTPEIATVDHTKSDGTRSFKGVRLTPKEIQKLSDLTINTEKDMLWMHDLTLADGNIVYVYTPSNHLNPFYYSADTSPTTVQPPTVENNSTLESISEDFKLKYTKHGWKSTTEYGRIEVNAHPISDEKLLEHLGELNQLLAHKV